MKHITLLVPVLAAAALAAAAGVPSPQAQASRSAPASPATPEAHSSQHAATDPHAGHLTSQDPHAQPYAAGDPHAALYAAEDPHAALHESNPIHLDPHAAAPHGARRPESVTVIPVARSSAANGRTVAEVFAQRLPLAGQRVSVRATVVKATDGVLGKTYLHLQDGSGSAELETNDLTATTTEAFEIGETVEVEGLLAIDQDVGLDYRYPALLGDVKRVR
jgi:hypothetical protein